MLSTALIKAQIAHALKTKALGPIETCSHVMQRENISFSVRVVTSLAKKKEARIDRTVKDVFAEPETDLVLADIVLPHHVALLNKFPVLDSHVLLVTKEWRSQKEFLRLEDFEALQLIRNPEESFLAFYNCGDESGRSQEHKHLQIVKYPFPNTTELQCGMDLPYLTAACSIDSWKNAQGNYEAYLGLLKEFDQEQIESHNVLVTDSVLMVVPRSKETWESISVNALGFAFSLFTMNEAGLKAIDDSDPMMILKNVGIAKL